MNDEILRFIYINAIRDATMQKAYHGEKKWLEDRSLFNQLKKPIISFINDILMDNNESQGDYDKKFLKLADELCSTINNQRLKTNSIFTFGNAQKLINIIVKYLYISTYNNLGNLNIRNNFRFCHCPMDGVMLEKVWNNRSQVSPTLDGYYRHDFLSSWSKENNANNREEYPKRYLDYQTAVRILANANNNSPIEYDYLNW